LLLVNGTDRSGTALTVLEPTGADEVFVVETPLAPLPALLELVSRVTRSPTGGPVDWPGRPATDLDAAVLTLRRSWIGDTIRTDIACPAPGCGERIDVSFGVGDYLGQHRPPAPPSRNRCCPAGASRLPNCPRGSPGAWTARSPRSRPASTTTSAEHVRRAGTWWPCVSIR
jgi:hypothetical protein